LGLVSHVGGQGLITYALAQLPAGFSSVALLAQPVVAAALAWGLLGEKLGAIQGMGGMVILGGIAVASLSPRQRSGTAAGVSRIGKEA
jgi:drug/metabolite transporter (DMT)-like permease